MALASSGRWHEADTLWREVQRHEPEHPQALHSLGAHASMRGRHEEALGLLQRAHRAAPQDPAILLTVALVLERLGDGEGRLRALDAALVRSPTLLPALAAKADCLASLGAPMAEVRRWSKNALDAAGPEAYWPDVLRPLLNAAAARVAQAGQALGRLIDQRLVERWPTLGPFEAARWREARAILCDGAKPFLPEPARLLVPRLAPLPFHDPARFPWVPGLQRMTDAIRQEFLALWQDAPDAFKPYIAFGDGAPVGAWSALNHSARWSSRFLWRDGVPQDDVQARCPATTEALSKVQMAAIDGFCPNAMFSVLAPHTAIPPHTGETNARLVVHLPLIVPPGCRYRVGADWCEWREGEVLIFDDSIEHEARNDSDHQRVILIFDVWNPGLSVAEREVVRQLSRALQDFEARA